MTPPVMATLEKAPAWSQQDDGNGARALLAMTPMRRRWCQRYGVSAMPAMTPHDNNIGSMQGQWWQCDGGKDANATTAITPVRQCNEGDSASVMTVTTPMQQGHSQRDVGKDACTMPWWWWWQCPRNVGDDTPIPQDSGEDAHAMAIMSMRQQQHQRNGGQDASATTAITHLRWGWRQRNDGDNASLRKAKPARRWHRQQHDKGTASTTLAQTPAQHQCNDGDDAHTMVMMTPMQWCPCQCNGNKAQLTQRGQYAHAMVKRWRSDNEHGGWDDLILSAIQAKLRS
jgi:hypothetical protein